MASLDSIGGIHYEMMKSCYNPKSVMYKDYGAKGITVCEEWHDREKFRQWAKDNGYTKGLRVDRKDVLKGYYPDNCFFGAINKKIHGGKSQKNKENSKLHKAKKIEIGVDKLVNSPLYRTYVSMHSRCEYVKHINYKAYGGRGIKVCEEWSGKDGIYNFLLWAKNNGWKKGLTLDRIDVDGNYCPENCRWVTWEIQGNNKRNVKKYNYQNQLLSLSQISRLENTTYSKLYGRIKKGMTLEQAINDCKINK